MGIKYTKLILGKPFAEIFVDDKGIEANSYFNNQLEDNKNYFKDFENFSLLHNENGIYEEIDQLQKAIAKVLKLMANYLLRNGGSFADAQHISGEFIKT